MPISMRSSFFRLAPVLLLLACGQEVVVPITHERLMQVVASGDSSDPAVTALLENLLADAGTAPNGLRSLGLACETNALWDLAIESLRAHLDVMGSDQSARLHLAICLHEAGAYEEELELLQEVVDSGEDLPSATYRLGVARLEVGEVEAAREQFAALAIRAPEQHHGHLGLGQALLEAGDPEQALGHLQKARELGQGDRFVEYAVGQCLADLGREAEAAPYLQRGANANRTHLADPLSSETQRYAVSRTGRLQRVTRLRAAGDRAAAVAILEQLKKEYPEDAIVLTNLGGVQRELGRIQDAEATLEAALALDGESYAAWFNLASTHLDAFLRERKETERVNLDLLGRAHAAAQNAALHGGHVAEMHEILAKCLTLMNEGDAALDAYAKALELGSDRQETYLAVARLHVLRQDRAAAFQVLSQAAERNADWVEVRVQIFPMVVDQRDSLSARRLIEEVSALVPGDRRVAAMRAMLTDNGL